MLSTIYWYSDFPAALRLGDAVFHGGWGQGLQVRSQSELATLWVVGLLNQVTGSSVASMCLGGLMLIASAELVVWTAHRVVGTRGAILAECLSSQLRPSWPGRF